MFDLRRSENRVLMLILILAISFFCVGESGAKESISLQIVETQPLGTELGHAEIENTALIWERLIAQAENKIQIGTFYAIDDENTQLSQILDLIKGKVHRGVKLEIVSDTVFYRNYPDVLDGFAELERAEVRIIDLDSRTGGVMHAKYFIVDSEHFYVGSANFDWRSLEHIREVGLAGSSRKIAAELQKIFEIDFKIAGRGDTSEWKNWQNLQPEPDYSRLLSDTISIQEIQPAVKVVATPPALTPDSILTSEEALLRMINTARYEIFIDIFQYGLTSPYASGYYDELDRALRRAAARGVEVKIQVSNWSLGEQQQRYLKSLQALAGIEVRYIDIPLSESGYISYARVSHPKVLVVDRDLAWLGSSNWQPGYFDQSRNVGIITAESKLVLQLRNFFLTAWNSQYAHSLRLDKSYSPPYRR